MFKQEAACRVNADVVEAYRRELAGMAAQGEEVPLSLLVTLPGVLTPGSADDETGERIGQLLLELTGEAVQEVVTMRKAEVYSAKAVPVRL